MTYTNIFDKIICLLNLSKNTWFNLAFLGITIIFIILLLKKKITRRTCFITLLITYLCLLGLTIKENYSILNSTATNLVDNLFTTIYFPSTYAYLFVLITMDLSIITSLFNHRIDRTIKTVNTIFFFLINFIFVIILQLISTNKIDIFSKTSLFSNKTLVTLLEFSINIFIFWLLALFIINTTNYITEKVLLLKEKRNLHQKNTPILNPAIETTIPNLDPVPNSGLTNPAPLTSNSESVTPEAVPQFIPTLNTNYVNPQLAVEQAYLNQQTTLQTTTTETNYPEPIPVIPVTQPITPTTLQANIAKETTIETTFDLSSFIPKKQPLTPSQPVSKDQLFEKIINNELPVIKEEPTIKSAPTTISEDEKNTYTLNDYRIFNKMLKEIRDHNQSNTITIDKNLEYRLITKYSTETYNLFKKMLKNYSN